MSPDIVVLNGGSSSGKSTLARRLQAMLADPWLTFSIDDLVDAMPDDRADLITFPADGAVVIGAAFRAVEFAWYLGLAAIARGGAGVIVDDNFLGGAASQERLRSAFAALDVLWVGVRCDPDVAAAREAARTDRPLGMARSQAELVHVGVHYDLEVDTTAQNPEGCARQVAEHMR